MNTKAANGIGPGAGKGARAEATERALRKAESVAAEKALRGFVALVAYLQRTTNPEEWATHSDWNRVQAEGLRALGLTKW